MKRLNINGAPFADADGEPLEADRIEQTAGTVTGYDAAGVEVFSLRGINPQANLSVTDESGVASNFDISSVQQAAEKAAGVKNDVRNATTIATLRTQVENLTDAVLALTEELRRRG